MLRVWCELGEELCLQETILLLAFCLRAQGGGRTRIPHQGLEGGVRPKAEKKVTSPILMAEVVVDVPKRTSDGSTGVQVVFELL